MVDRSTDCWLFPPQVDGELWDLERPFEKSASLELLDFEHPEGKRGRQCAQSGTAFRAAFLTRVHVLAGKKVWWHSSAHILGECCERHYGCHLAIGPPTDEGFFYEMGMTDDR